MVVAVMLSAASPGTTLLAAVALAIVALVVRGMGRSWLEPAPFFAFCWSGFVWVPLLLAPEYPVSPLAVLWVVVSVTAVAAGAWLAGGADIGGHQRPRLWLAGSRIFLPRPLLLAMLALSVALGFLYLYTFLRALGFGVIDLFSLRGVVRLAATLSRMRYEDPSMTAPSLFVQALLPFVYFSGAMGGVLLAYRARRSDYLWVAMALLPSLAVTVVTTAKQPVLVGVGMLLSAWFCARIYRFGGFGRVKRKRLLMVGVAVSAFGVALIGVQVLRSGEAVDAAADHLKPSVAGHMAAFSSWLEATKDSDVSRVSGAYTFAGPFQLLGLADRAQGLYATSVELNPLKANQTSNVYTAYRGLIEDFGYLGCLCVLAFMAHVSEKAYQLVRAGGLGGAAVLLPYYVWVMWSFVVSIFNYNTIIAAFVLFWLLLLMARQCQGGSQGVVYASTLPRGHDGCALRTPCVEESR